jgi:soluble lytic murein transglycosylase-like protein
MTVTTLRSRRPVLACVVAGVITTMLPLAARAELWGYIDGAGVAHVAQIQVDSRYHAVLDSASPTAQNVRGKADDTSRLLIWLEIAPEVRALMPILREVAREQAVDVELLTAVVAVESGFKARVVSPRGAIGLMQLTPDAANRYASKAELQTPAARRLLDPRTNVSTGARMLADLTRRFHSIDVALAAWNAGEGAVRRSGGKMPAIDETQAHVHLVLELYWALLQNPLARHATQLKIQSDVPGL